MGKRVNLNTVLDFLRTPDVNNQSDEERRIGREFVKLWPQHGETLNKFRDKPGCGSCRHSMLDVLSEEPAKVGKLLRQINPDEDWSVDPTANRAVSTARPPMPVPAKPNSLVGKSFDIPDTPEAYEQFMETQRRQGARYMGLAVRALESQMVRLYFF